MLAYEAYRELGLQDGTAWPAVKGQYRKLALEWHPDKHPGDRKAEEKFKRINQAYEFLQAGMAQDAPRQRQKHQNQYHGPGDFSNFHWKDFDADFIRKAQEDFARAWGGGGFGSGTTSNSHYSYGDFTGRIKIKKKCPHCDGKGFTEEYQD